MHQHREQRETAALTPRASGKRSRNGSATLPEPTVREIETMGREALAALWLRVHGTAVPAQMSRSILRRFLAFEVQSRRAGGVSAGLAARLSRIARDAGRPQTPTPAPGARLLREWNGTTHVVDVVDGGFLWNGTRHRSLSAIAREITGARWSGPRFFGLTAMQRVQAK